MNWWVKSKNDSYNSKYIKHFLILASTITWCISIYDFASLIVPLGITSSVIRLKIYIITAGIKKSIIKKKKKKYNKITSLAKSKLIE